MIRVEGGSLEIGATKEQEDCAETNEYPAHKISLPTFYIAQFPVTQNIWELVMGYNKSHFKHAEENLPLHFKTSPYYAGSKLGAILGVLGSIGYGTMKEETNMNYIGFDNGHFPVENITHDEAVEFVRRLSKGQICIFRFLPKKNGSTLHVVDKKVNTIDSQVATI